MNRFFCVFFLLMLAGTALGQPAVKVLKQQSLKRYGIPPGNYSGITHIGGNRYAVCDDKSPDGIHLWDIDIDLQTGKICDVRNVTFCPSGAPSRDTEDIAYMPDLQTLYMVSEADSRIYAYALDGTPLDAVSAPLLPGKNHSTGLEALTYDSLRHCLWVMQENDGTNYCPLFSLNTHLSTLNTLLYPLAPPTGRAKAGAVYIHGVSAICATTDGRLLVLEREAYVPPKKIGAWVRVKLFSIHPDRPSEKQLLVSWRTRLNLTARSWANYEGMCLGQRLTDGRQVLILLSDSQNHYGGILQDRIRTVLLPPSAIDGSEAAEYPH